MINSPVKILFLNKDIILFCDNYQDDLSILFVLVCFSTFVFIFWWLVFDEFLRFLGCLLSCLWSFRRICFVVVSILMSFWMVG
jgi:hypothetical protein